MTKKQLLELIVELKDGEVKDLELMTLMTNRINLLETQSNYNVENLRLLMEYLGVHLENKGKIVVEDDECDCDDWEEELNTEEVAEWLREKGYKVKK